MAVMPIVKPGDPAPEFTLPAADRDTVVSLAHYRGQTPVFLALFRGLYCPFCRRQIAQLSPTAQRLRDVGIETVGVVATAAERARLYFRLNPPRFPLAADPELVTHRAYGLPSIERNDAAADMIEHAAQRELRTLGLAAAAGRGREVLDVADGFERTTSDAAERTRHQIQLLGQFLIDRDGYVRWVRTEDRTTYAIFPGTDELLALAERAED